MLSAFIMKCVEVLAFGVAGVLMIQVVLYVLVKMCPSLRGLSMLAGRKSHLPMKVIFIVGAGLYWFLAPWVVGLMAVSNWWWPLALYGIPIFLMIFIWNMTQRTLTGCKIGKGVFEATFAVDEAQLDDMDKLLVSKLYYEQAFRILHTLSGRLRESHLIDDLEIALKNYLETCKVPAEIRLLSGSASGLNPNERNQCCEDRWWLKRGRVGLLIGYVEFTTRKGVVYVELTAGSAIMESEELLDGIRSIMERGCPNRQR